MKKHDVLVNKQGDHLIPRREGIATYSVSSSFSSSRSNRDVTSFPRNCIVGTDRPTDIVSYRDATSRLKIKEGLTKMKKQERATINRRNRNFDVTSFRHQLISSSFSSSRSNRDVTSFRSDMGTNRRTNQHSLL
jgi:hypothetical protein